MKLISQQAAIEAVVGCTNCGTEDVLRAYVTKHSLENGWTGGIVDALDAIEQLPSAEPCGDAVSRNAIIQKLNTMDRYVSTELRLCDTDKKFPQNEVFIVDDVYEEIVEQLPSAQPEPEAISEWKKEFREYVGSLDIARDDWKGIIEYIDELPPIQSERKGTRLSTVCLLCKKPAVSFNTEDDIPYTNYSYCEDCLRKGLKLLREQKKSKMCGSRNEVME